MNRTRPAETKADAPLVSIAMCTYNGESFLAEQMDSLIAQNYPNLEIIITDDRSTDSTIDILREYERKHGFITVIQNESNLGYARNFEKAISLCKGEFIALCDQDDIWFPTKISTLMAEIGDASLIYTPTEMVDETGNMLNTQFHDIRNLQLVSGKCYKSLIFENCILGHTVLFKRNLLDHALPFPTGITAHDQWLAIIAAIHGEIKLHRQPVSRYRMHSANTALKGNTRKTRQNILIRRCRRTRSMAKKYRNIQTLLNALSHMEILPNEERAVFEDLRNAHARFYSVFTNRKLAKLIEQNEEDLLAICSNKKKAIRKICRGYWAGILR